jgi:hypothetical protein
MMSRLNDIRFQKTLAVFAGASNTHEAEAAELAARRLMAACSIDPIDFPTKSLYNRMNFADSVLLKKLRDEWLAAHPAYYYGVLDSWGARRRLKHKPRPRKPKPVDHHEFDGLSGDVLDERLQTLVSAAQDKPEAPVDEAAP